MCIKLERFGLLAIGTLTLVFCASAVMAGEERDTPVHVNLDDDQLGSIFEAYVLMNSPANYDPDLALQRHTNYLSLNEFERRASREAYIDQIETRIALDTKLLDEVDYFVWNLRLGFGEFDFDHNAFPIVEVESARGNRLRRDRVSPGPFDVPLMFGRGSWFLSRPVGQYHRGTSRFHFDWQPATVDYSFPDAASAQRFLENFSRRPNARMLVSLEGTEIRNDTHFLLFSVQCLLIYSQQGDAVHFGQIVPATGDPTACDQHRGLIAQRGLSGALIGIREIDG